MRIKNSLCFAIIFIPIFAINTYSQSAVQLATFLPDTLGEFIATKAAVKKEKHGGSKGDSVQVRVQRGYSSPNRPIAIVAIIYGNGVPEIIKGVFSKKGTLISISKFDAIILPHEKNDPISKSVRASVKILNNMIVTIMVVNTTNKKYPISILQKLDLKGLSTLH